MTAHAITVSSFDYFVVSRRATDIPTTDIHVRICIGLDREAVLTGRFLLFMVAKATSYTNMRIVIKTIAMIVSRRSKESTI